MPEPLPHEEPTLAEETLCATAARRAAADRALTESDERYRLLVENLGEGVAYVDPAEYFTFANPAVEVIFGVARGQLVGRLLLDFLEPDARRLVLHEAGIRRQNRASRYQHHIVRPDGGRRAVAVTATPRFDAAGTFLGTFSVFRDITEQKALQDRLGLLVHAVKGTADGICIVDPQGHMLFANDAFFTSLGYSPEELVNRPVTDVGEPGGPMVRILQETLAHGSWRGEVNVRRRDGSEFPLLLSTSVARDEDGRVQAAIGVGRDITNRKLAETEAKRRTAELELAKIEAENANRAKSDFLAQMSHELRTPMNGITGMAGLLLDTGLSPEQREYAEAICNCADALLSAINSILDLSKIEAGKVVIEAGPFDLVECLRNAGELLAPPARAKGLEYRFYSDAACRLVVGDAARIRQIVLNLLSNAIKFTDRGSVTLSVIARDTPGGHLLLTAAVEDTGIGIPAGELPLLFHNFSQLDSSLTRRYDGAGLGLAISRRLAQLMGATISVESTPGKGSRFQLEIGLPAAAPPRPDTPGAATARPAASGHRRVLVADDNAVNRKLAARILGKLGCAVDVATNGREAVEMACNAAYDLVLMDCMMPDMDGYAATREIRRRAPGPNRVPILAMTAQALAGAREDCLEAGMDDYLTKPVTPADLKRILETWAPYSAENRTGFPCSN